MPNWCENYVTISGNEDAIQRLVEVKFDFNAVKAEPAWEVGDDDSWYDWRLENWGCKWNRNEADTHVLDYDSQSAKVSFTTPWGPPIGLYDTLQDMNIDVEAFFFEPGMQSFGIYSKRHV
jgi:hypothetical protein